LPDQLNNGNKKQSWDSIFHIWLVYT